MYTYVVLRYINEREITKRSVGTQNGTGESLAFCAPFMCYYLYKQLLALKAYCDETETAYNMHGPCCVFLLITNLKPYD